MACFNVVSLFSGAGGLDWGFREAGFEVVFANDVLEAPMRTYSRNFGLRLSYCRGGKQHTASAGEALVCDVSMVDFSRLGVPQKRERLIVVGVRRDLAVDRETAAAVRKALVPDGAFSRFPLTPIEVFEGKILPDLQHEYREAMRKWDGVWLEVNTRRAWEWKRDVWDRLTFDAVKDYLAVSGVAGATEEELEEAWRAHRSALEEIGYLGVRVCSRPLPDGTCSLPEDTAEVKERMRRIPPGENHEFVRGTRWEVEGRGISLVYRRIHPLKPSYTVVAYGGGGTHGYHYDSLLVLYFV